MTHESSTHATFKFEDASVERKRVMEFPVDQVSEQEFDHLRSIQRNIADRHAVDYHNVVSTLVAEAINTIGKTDEEEMQTLVATNVFSSVERQIGRQDPDERTALIAYALQEMREIGHDRLKLDEVREAAELRIENARLIAQHNEQLDAIRAGRMQVFQDLIKAKAIVDDPQLRGLVMMANLELSRLDSPQVFTSFDMTAEPQEAFSEVPATRILEQVDAPIVQDSAILEVETIEKQTFTGRIRQLTSFLGNRAMAGISNLQTQTRS